jgi:hypothetical protein
MEIDSVSSKEAFLAELKKYMYLSKENFLCQNQEHLAHGSL